MRRSGVRAGMALGLALALVAPGLKVQAQTAPATRIGPQSGAPVPRFESLKFDETNGRRGPGHEHRIDWVYHRAGLPVQVIAESGPWRQIRDPEGGTVWVHASNLSSRRTAYVTASDVALRRREGPGGRVVATLEQGVVGVIGRCRGEGVQVTVQDFTGWVPASTVWGAEGCATAPAVASR